jgi:hypothetical protein
MTFSPPGFRSPRPNHFSFATDDLPRLTPPAAPEQAAHEKFLMEPTPMTKPKVEPPLGQRPSRYLGLEADAHQRAGAEGASTQGALTSGGSG